MAGLCALLWYELHARGNLGLLWQEFLYQSREGNAALFALALLLMPLNWLIETQKWYPLVRRYDPISYRDALRAVLAGSTLSLFSPNRLGDYGGRVLFVQPQNQWKSVMAQVVGGFGQLVVLLVAGAAGAVWSLGHVWRLEPPWYGWSAAAGTVISVGVVLFYFHFKAVITFARRWPWLQPIKRYVKDVWVLEAFKRPELWQILGWSALRYGVSCFQYYLLLLFFGIKTSPLEAFSCIAAIFLFQTCLPLPPVANFFARSNVAIWVWSAFGANEFSSLATTFSLWIINLFLPALLGTFSILYVNIAKSLGYENE